METKRVNEAVRNNPEKFPPGYVVQLTKEETSCLRSKFSTLNRGQHSKYLPKAFTEKGLYMLATEDEEKRNELVNRSGECLSELLEGELQVCDMETTLEVNLAMLKFKHIVKRRK